MSGTLIFVDIPPCASSVNPAKAQSSITLSYSSSDSDIAQQLKSKRDSNRRNQTIGMGRAALVSVLLKSRQQKTTSDNRNFDAHLPSVKPRLKSNHSPTPSSPPTAGPPTSDSPSSDPARALPREQAREEGSPHTAPSHGSTSDTPAISESCDSFDLLSFPSYSCSSAVSAAMTLERPIELIRHKRR
jgi:hypothetical protein